MGDGFQSFRTSQAGGLTLIGRLKAVQALALICFSACAHVGQVASKNELYVVCVCVCVRLVLYCSLLFCLFVVFVGWFGLVWIGFGLFVCLSDCLFVCFLFIGFLVWFGVVCLSVCLCVCLFVCMCWYVCMFICLFIGSLVCLFVCLFVCLLA